MNTVSEPILSKQEAIQAMKDGKKVRHRYFMAHEYVYMKNDRIYGEDGINISANAFWHYRIDSAWETDWTILNP